MIAAQPFSKENSNQKIATDANNNDLDSNLKAIRDGSRNLVDHVKDDALVIAHGVAAESSEKMKDVKSYAMGYAKKIEHEVAVNPVRSVAIAFATGYLANFIFGRR